MTPKEARALWVEALRSGEYKRGTGYLRSHDNFCCLGVACDLYKQEVKPDAEWESVSREDIGPLDHFSFMDAVGTLPLPVMKWLGLSDHVGELRRHIQGDPGSLIDVNDGGHSFTFIADLIEEGYVKLAEEEQDEH